MALNEITKGMSNAAEQINGNFKQLSVFAEDTGWINAIVDPTFVTKQKIPLAFRKVGKTVYVRGQFIVKPFPTEAFTNIGKVPDNGFVENTDKASFFAGWASDVGPLNVRIIYNHANHPTDALKLALEVRGTRSSSEIEVSVNTSYMIDN